MAAGACQTGPLLLPQGAGVNHMNELLLLALLAVVLLVCTVVVCVFVLPVTIFIGWCYFVVTFAVGSLSPNTIEDKVARLRFGNKK